MNQSLAEFLSEWNDASTRLLVHTSGSTGRPKPLWVEKRRMQASARMTCSFLGLREGDSALLCMPLDYIAGKMMVVRALTCGLRLVAVEPDGHPMAHLSDADDVPDFVAMVPLQVYNTLQVPSERARLMRVRHLLIGGGAIDSALEQSLRAFPNAVWSSYGMTETLSHVALRRLNGPEQSPWYTPLPSVSVAVNEDGCLVVSAPLVCDGPLVTNDVAQLRDGRFRIVGRRDNVVCTGGLKVQIEDVEQRLRPHMPVPFCITACSDERLGQSIVMLAEGGQPRLLDDLCRRLLPRYWRPHHIIVVPRVPMTATGKIARQEALRMAAAAVDGGSADR